ncbi:glycogen synthase [Tichowtungia aerotolerans]|uniref:starch synthase n=1 Tax=Tichowtungia aerotolerans TaxID=2697043 RepID=A0A6P1M7Z8_9BACT|nr:glycogen/starch synthase [Tichowtungia aerotolerans]QHI70007.1 glycosyltransferase [Tichowtungia aerotolerans]
MNILMVASENDGIAKCKVGGIGDVIRDVPVALSNNGCNVSVVTPSYGYLHETPGAEQIADIAFPFSGAEQMAVLYRVRPRTMVGERASHYVIDHPAFKMMNEARGEFEIYSHDIAERPFATDATKFACFNAAVGAAIKEQFFGPLDILHLHDWHTAFLLILRQFDPIFAPLKNLRTAYTIHNLSLQGIRPFENDASSLESWFPRLELNTDLLNALSDPRWPDCVNPMATGIRLADAVHTVSPTYAKEILSPSRPPEYFGGEGLEHDLKAAMNEGRLHGILNGCEYSEPRSEKMPISDLLALIKKEAARWASKCSALNLADYAAFQTLEKISNARKKPAFVATGISRIVDQKMLILKSRGSNRKTGLENMLEMLGKDRLFILLGTGDPETEAFLAEAAIMHPNFLFLNSYSNAIAGALYTCGDLFLMPSSFEPCGIGQMLAMRAGQPCLVHRTGGLNDTVTPGVNGFGFEGATLTEQVDGMGAALGDALDLHSDSSNDWKTICDAATQARFEWDSTAKQYIEKLYHS